jgi:RimJ/RimL family protein N-acetyltransferase
MSRNLLGAVRRMLSSMIQPLFRHDQRVVWEVDPRTGVSAAPLQENESIAIIGPENIDSELNPRLLSFMGGESIHSEIEGVRQGDYLFVFRRGEAYLAYSFIFFATTENTRRQTRVLQEEINTPVIGLSYTAPEARGQGLYRKILISMFAFLAAKGCSRAVCEIEPNNNPSNRASQAVGMRPCRELSDWRILRRLLIQKVSAFGNDHWRLLWLW